MQYRTYAEVLEEVRQETDTEAEIFIQPSEMIKYCNKGIDEAEAEIHTIYEDYFLKRSPLISLVNGQVKYDLPTDIYANKLRAIIYRDGADFYRIHKLKGRDKFLAVADLEESASSENYRFLVHNDGPSINPQIGLYPTPNGTGSIEYWYLRNANRVTDENSIIDIPEFTQFVIQFMVVKVYEKEGHPNLVVARADLEKYRRLMIDTLSQMIPDGDNEIEPDLDFYTQHY